MRNEPSQIDLKIVDADGTRSQLTASVVQERVARHRQSSGALNRIVILGQDISHSMFEVDVEFFDDAGMLSKTFPSEHVGVFGLDGPAEFVEKELTNTQIEYQKEPACKSNLRRLKIKLTW